MMTNMPSIASTYQTRALPALGHIPDPGMPSVVCHDLPRLAALVRFGSCGIPIFRLIAEGSRSRQGVLGDSPLCHVRARIGPCDDLSGRIRRSVQSWRTTSATKNRFHAGAQALGQVIWGFPCYTVELADIKV